MMDSKYIQSAVVNFLEAIDIHPDDRVMIEKAYIDKARTIPGFDMGRVYNDWRNESLQIAMEGHKDRVSYSDFIKEKIENPYRLTKVKIDKITEIHGSVVVNYMNSIKMNQEITWAKRFCGSPNDAISAYSYLWISKCGKDFYKEFLNITEIYNDNMVDISYKIAPENQYDLSTIRFIDLRVSFIPLYRRKGFELFKMKSDPISLSAIAQKARMYEMNDKSDVIRTSFIQNIVEYPLRRMVNVIAVAAEMGMTSDQLYYAEMEFIEEIKKKSFDIQSDFNFPYKIFIQWLRMNGSHIMDISYPVDDISTQEHLLSVIAKPVSFIDSLGVEYAEMGANRHEYFREWIVPYTDNSRLLPRDMMSDYGFFLVKKELQ